jgi:hypothetical protein
MWRTDYRGSVYLTSSDAQAMLPATCTFTASDNCAHTFTATLKTTLDGGLAGIETAIVVNPA